jgi:phage FluMu protein Com
MPRAQRSSDIVEEFSEKAVTYGFSGLVGVAISTLLIAYRGESGMLVPLASIIGFLGVGAVVYAGYNVYLARQVGSIDVSCPFCAVVNKLVSTPEEDFTCAGCHRLIPISGGIPMPVHQVRCGYCNDLNYFSDKTEVLLCESCNHEIPIQLEEGRVSKRIATGYAVREDESLYELVLVAHGHKTEELISALQHMLALNRNQVKQMLQELPVTLMTGITRKKADMLSAQLHSHEALTDIRQLPNTATLR